MPEKLRIIFMGTPEFAVESLRALLEDDQQIVGVITAPDKPAGRGKQTTESPVKQFARQAGIKPVLQPENLKSPEFIEKLKALHADLQVVVAFRMLPEVVWLMPPKGTVNLHASLLPDYRGAAPINWCIINGEKESGVTTFFIEKDIDTGKIIFRDKVEIGPRMNAGQLHDILMEKGAQLLVKTINAISENQYPAISQSELTNSIIIRQAPKIYRDNCRINWNNNAEQIYNLIRGLSPYPTAWTEITDGSSVLMLKLYESTYEIKKHSYTPGTLFSDKINYLKVAASGGFISILSLQMAGKKRMDVSEFLRGFKNITNYILH